MERGLTVVDSIGSYPGAGDVLYLSALEDAEGIQPGEDVADSVYVRLSRVDEDARVDLGIKDWGRGLQSTSLLRRGELRPDD